MAVTASDHQSLYIGVSNGIGGEELILSFADKEHNPLFTRFVATDRLVNELINVLGRERILEIIANHKN